ncbi:hypothetical protein [Bifidobacterium felsineum]|uniref:hypothetical protein n=1 Tax=Bifidobacterium felsineum TaxID=2045440 RepID=UPI001BDCB53C|nr:hypothetical protein [Bifidobacterium felsineum]MBT1164649.1 hypothetical protein [Bifidobacterium felsineum]
MVFALNPPHHGYRPMPKPLPCVWCGRKPDIVRINRKAFRPWFAAVHPNVPCEGMLQGEPLFRSPSNAIGEWNRWMTRRRPYAAIPVPKRVRYDWVRPWMPDSGWDDGDRMKEQAAKLTERIRERRPEAADECEPEFG